MVVESKPKSRGAVAPGMRQVNWRIRVDLLEKAGAERVDKHFKSTPAFINYILQNRYYPDEPTKAPR